MKKVPLRFPEGFTIHAKALINQVHSQSRQKKQTTLESKLRLIGEFSPLITTMGDALSKQRPIESLMK